MKKTFKNLKRTYQFGKEYKKHLIYQVIGCVLVVVVNILKPLLLAKFIIEFTEYNWNQTIITGLLLLILEIISSLKTVLIRKNTQIVRRGIVKNIQMKLGKEILDMKQSDLDKTSSGIFLQRLTIDSDKLAELFTTGMGYLTAIISNIGAFIAIFIIEYKMGLYYLFASFILTLLNYVKTKKYALKDSEYRDKIDKVTSLSSELVKGNKDIKMLFAKKTFLDKLSECIDNQNSKNFEMRNIEINYNLLIEIFNSIFSFGVIIVLILLVVNNDISIAIALALFNYKDFVLTDLMTKVSALFEECGNFNVSCKRIYAIIDSIDFQKEKFGDKKIKEFNGTFEFKNVNFSYGEKSVLNDLSFKIESGLTVGIVGKSGAGKSSIYNLIAKLYDVLNNQIYLDNNDINVLDEESIRNNITIINQSPYIFNLSIKDNLKLVNQNFTEEEMIEACKLACLNDFILTLPNKYDTVLGEGGVNLSGGQKQRLAIA
ncbi:MAG: ABC transporter ATP-binding protein, partial [Mycoplasmatota bacterium]